MEKKIAFFDIDNTLIYGDSLFSLFRFGAKKRPYLWLTLPAIGAMGLLYALNLVPVTKVKELIYLPLKFMKEEDYEAFFQKHILDRKIEASFNELLRLKREGYYILLVTASAEAYMEYWEKKGYADKVIGTKTNCGSNKITGPNCHGQQKVIYIKEFLKEQGIEPNFENSIGFSDSNKDIPMLALCKTRIRVQKDGTLVPFKP